MSLKITDHVKGMANFAFYRAGNLYYVTNDTALEFPVPIEDTDGATFDASYKSITLMRWIRRHIATLNAATTETLE